MYNNIHAHDSQTLEYIYTHHINMWQRPYKKVSAVNAFQYTGADANNQTYRAVHLHVSNHNDKNKRQ